MFFRSQLQCGCLRTANRFLALAVAFVDMRNSAVCILNFFYLFIIKIKKPRTELDKTPAFLMEKLVCVMMCLCGVGEQDKILHFTKVFFRHAVAAGGWLLKAMSLRRRHFFY